MMEERKEKSKFKIIAIIVAVILVFIIGVPIHLNNGYRGKTVECETLGCRLILPDGWDGKCDFVMVDEGAYVIICASDITSTNFREEYNELYNQINQIKIEMY